VAVDTHYTNFADTKYKSTEDTLWTGIGYIINPVAGSYAYSGVAATFPWTHILDVGVSSYALDGKTAGTYWGREVVAEAEAYAIDGKVVTFKATRLISIGPGAIVVDGKVAAFFVKGSMFAVDGAITITGTVASLEWGRKVSVGVGAIKAIQSLLVTDNLWTDTADVVWLDTTDGIWLDTPGPTTQLYKTSKLGIGSGAYALSGKSITGSKDNSVVIGTGVFVISGTSASLLFSKIPTSFELSMEGDWLYKETSPHTYELRQQTNTEDYGTNLVQVVEIEVADEATVEYQVA
jgi:hypothetical protein